MAKVSLRVYNHEIEGMIEGGHLDEAVAHCQHILKTFPMHIETYRLLGKTFLEARRYSDAADIFQRALMAVPDDFVSHVGMSIIRDDEGKLDEAIWHMERAFEVQPSNPAIQGELRRLYGRRDGVEPPKIRLSRDALANMYAQGELFSQAISEIRSVLAEDPNRPDLQVMLARAYYRAGQKVEAAEMASTLLKKYPYCMDGLRVLVDVLPGTGRGENTQIYRQRLRLLDPYSSFSTSSAFASDQVADTAVIMERLDYQGGGMPASQPNWAASLGINLSGEKRSEPVPDWMKNATSPETPAGFNPIPAVAPAPDEPVSPAAPPPAAAESSVPDWMRTAGWQESTGAAQEGPSDLSQEPPAEPIAKADIPDWLQSMAPAGTTDAVQPESETNDQTPFGDDTTPDWLANLGGDKPASDAPQQSASADANVPDWLANLGGEQAAPDVGSSLFSSPAGSEFTPEPSQDQPIDGGALPDWLAGLGGDKTDIPAEPTTPPSPIPPSVDHTADQPTLAHMAAPQEPLPPMPPTPAPDNQVGSSLPPMEGDAFQPTGEAKPLEIGDDALGWLESLAAKQGAKPEELLTNPQERSEEVPDWLKEINAASGDSQEPPVPPKQDHLPASLMPTLEEELPAAEPPAPVVEVPAPPVDQTPQPAVHPPVEVIPDLPDLDDSLSLQSPPEGTAQPVQIEDDTMAWLERLAANQGAKPEELLTHPEDRPETTPEWIQKVVSETPAAEEKTAESAWTEPIDRPELTPDRIEKAVPTEPVSQSEAPAAPQPPQASFAGEPEDATITSWLSNLDKTETDVPMPAVPQAESEAQQTPQEDLPEWLKDLNKPVTPQPEPEPGPEAPQAETDLPDWLRAPASPGQTHMLTPLGSAPQSPGAEPEMPAWMDETAPVADQAAPTAPEEWVPAEKAPPSDPPSTVRLGSDEIPSADTPFQVPRIPIAVEPPTPVKKAPAEQVASIPRDLKATGPLSSVPPADKDADLLSAAQAALAAGSLEEAMKTYAKLVKKGRLLDEVIHDLKETIYLHPVDVVVWQTLGDAYMRANRLQEALDAFTKAEELLR
ncbi:MAG TPA: tetratricopeptide repeat protein [Anaerolineales bacterium]|nr:tetratricopeptide repeat protein [Anaerolineales bacterium]